MQATPPGAGDAPGPSRRSSPGWARRVHGLQTRDLTLAPRGTCDPNSEVSALPAAAFPRTGGFAPARRHRSSAHTGRPLLETSAWPALPRPGLFSRDPKPSSRHRAAAEFTLGPQCLQPLPTGFSLRTTELASRPVTALRRGGLSAGSPAPASPNPVILHLFHRPNGSAHLEPSKPLRTRSVALNFRLLPPLTRPLPFREFPVSNALSIIHFFLGGNFAIGL